MLPVFALAVVRKSAVHRLIFEHVTNRLLVLRLPDSSELLHPA